MTLVSDMRRRLVIDPSVAVKWYMPETHAEIARRFLMEDNKLFAPEFIWAEMGNVLLNKHRTGGLTVEDADEIWRAFARVPLELRPAHELTETAFVAARETGRSFYDCLYLALAIQTGSMLVTADSRFHNAIAVTSWARFCVHITNFA